MSLSEYTLRPTLIQFNAAADNDQQFLQFIKLPAGSYLTFDKGYNNYQQYAAFTAAEVFFITRQKDNAVYKSVRGAFQIVAHFNDENVLHCRLNNF